MDNSAGALTVERCYICGKPAVVIVNVGDDAAQALRGVCSKHYLPE